MKSAIAPHTTYRKTRINSPATSISSGGSSSAWVADINKQLVAAEEAERGLSYVSACGSEKVRKFLGSYYTPIDVARYFWNEYFELTEIDHPSKACEFVSTHRFVEPSVGAGALFFALLEKLATMGLSPELVATVDIEFIEINESALAFVKDRMDELQGKWDVRFKNVRFLNQDFRDVAFKRSRKPRVFFGNPPFVTNGRGVSRWKNLFADFLEISLQVAGPRGAVQYILPFSIAFSRDYQDLRDILRGRPSKIRLSHFDNIPDTLFKFGKPLHSNTNKANSQRCTILSVVPGENLSISSTPLLRWTKAERSTILGRSPLYYDVTAYGFDDQIPRPCDERILQYLEQSLEAPRLRNLMDKKGRHSVFVANVARNFIGIRDKPGTGTHDLRFRVRDDAHKALAVISSDLFFHYWLSIGDGFHVTKSNLLDFPIHPALQKMLAGRLPALRKTWRKRKSYLKTKLNSGRETRSYDFSGSFDSLYLSRPYLKG